MTRKNKYLDSVNRQIGQPRDLVKSRISAQLADILLIVFLVFAMIVVLMLVLLVIYGFQVPSLSYGQTQLIWSLLMIVAIGLVSYSEISKGASLGKQLYRLGIQKQRQGNLVFVQRNAIKYGSVYLVISGLIAAYYRQGLFTVSLFILLGLGLVFALYQSMRRDANNQHFLDKSLWLNVSFID